jgi:hypothetical protein
MDERELLDALARVAREDREVVEFLEALGRGEQVPPPAVAADGLRQASRACRTLDFETREQIVERALHQAATPEAPPSGPRPLRLVPIQGRTSPRWRRHAWLSAAIAAAAVLLWVRSPSAPPLPGYELTISGGARGTRSHSAEAVGDLVLPPGSQFEIVLRPLTRAQGAVAVRVVLVRPQAVRPLDLPADISQEGSVRILGTADEIDAAPGTWDLVVAVGRPQSLPSEPRGIAALSAVEAGGAVQVFRRRLVLGDGWKP